MTTSNVQKDIADNQTTQDQLKKYIERIERLTEEKKSLGADINEIFSEAKGNGFDVKAMKAVIKIRSMDPSEQETIESLVDTYKIALGMV